MPLDPAQRSMILVDRQIGIEAEPVIVDRATGRHLDSDDFVYTTGPAAGPAMRGRHAEQLALGRA